MVGRQLGVGQPASVRGSQQAVSYPRRVRAGKVESGVTPTGDPVRARRWSRWEVLRRVPLWTLIAVGIGNLAAAVSRILRVGSGGMIGGRVTLVLDPKALRRLCSRRSVVLITGTNGKTTTTRMINAALVARGPVASNDTGANMPDGLVAALSHNLAAPYAALEIDERHFARVAPSLRPDTVVLLNLSSDQLDRFGEIRELERGLRKAVEQLDHTRVIANSKDVLVTSAASAAPQQSWVAAVAASWTSESNVCPRCGSYIDFGDTAGWQCHCGLLEPRPDWSLDGGLLHAPDGAQTHIEVAVPGDINLTNAAMAIAATATFGVDGATAADAIRTVTDVQGRYQTVVHDGHTIRLLLAKNPAGWAETLRIVNGTSGTVLIAINAREADGRDLSWLWDVPFEELRGRNVIAAGEGVEDLAVRLTYADVAYTTEADPVVAISATADENIELISNYTAFNGVRRRLDIA